MRGHFYGSYNKLVTFYLSFNIMYTFLKNGRNKNLYYYIIIILEMLLFDSSGDKDILKKKNLN